MPETAERPLDATVREPSTLHDVRVALSPHLFRGMLVAMAAAAVAIHRTTGSRDLAWRFAKARARDLAWMLGVTIHVRGLEHVPADPPAIYTPNHQSHLDILALLAVLPGRPRFAAKRELWRHAVVGAVLDTLGMIPIDRERPADAIAQLNRRGAERDPLVIFPEGTRSRDGRLGELRKGAFVLAIRLGRPVVPVVCRGTRRLMPPGGGMRVEPGEVEIIVERPIATIGLGHADRDALAARVRAAILAHHTGW